MAKNKKLVLVLAIIGIGLTAGCVQTEPDGEKQVTETWSDLNLLETVLNNATVDGVVYLASPACAMGSTAMIISKLDPQVTPDSLASAVGYTKIEGGYQNPEQGRPFIPCDLYSLVTSAGYKLYLGYLPSSTTEMGNPYQQYINQMDSQTVKEFESVEEATETFKKALASGYAVEIIVDYNDLNKAFDSNWTDLTEEQDHYMVAVGYDAGSVNLYDPNTQNPPFQQEWEVPWDVFMTAWEDTLAERESAAPPLMGYPGAYVMFIITE